MDAGQLGVGGAADDDHAAQIGALGVAQSEARDGDQTAVEAVGGVSGRPHDEITRRRALWFDPYHHAIEAELTRLRALHPRASKCTLRPA